MNVDASNDRAGLPLYAHVINQEVIMVHRRTSTSPLSIPLPTWLAIVLATILAVAAQGNAAAQSLGLEAVSNRADLISGGDVLVRVTLPSNVGANQAVLILNGQPLANPLHAASDGKGYLALVTGLNLGHNTLMLAAGGSALQLDVTNYPIGGPVFSGPHLQPWTCTTTNAGLGSALDADCNAPPQFAFFYKNAATGQFVAYDPGNPPPSAQIAMTTTDRGVTVPYVVRVETGALDRSIYKITVLFNPDQPWTPWAPQPAWNGKVVHMFGAGAGTMYTQGTIANAFDDNSLARGFATTAATLTNHGTISNTKLNAETLMMLKEHLAEAYGPIRYTIAQGCSGGAIQQHSVGDQYPGLVDGMLPNCSYPDIWSLYLVSTTASCSLAILRPSRRRCGPTLPDRLAVIGLNSEQECPAQDGPPAFGTRFFVTTNTSCALPTSALYDPVSNPNGVRCSMKDYHINELGTRADGFVYQVADNVGLQYGLNAVNTGRITPEQFVDLNEKIGGLDVAGNYQAARTAADPLGLQRIYQTGLITYGRELGKYPIIDARTNDNHEMHNNSEWMFTRNRLLRTNGNASNEIHWWETEQRRQSCGNVSRPSAVVALKSVQPDGSLAGGDRGGSEQSPTRSQGGAQQAVRSVRCVLLEADVRVAGRIDLRHEFTYTGLSRMVAGGPNTNDVFKCQLKPLDRAGYNVAFTDAQWARLQQIFPTGVCDFSKPASAATADGSVADVQLGTWRDAAWPTAHGA
jgi:hypothetical protein